MLFHFQETYMSVATYIIEFLAINITAVSAPFFFFFYLLICDKYGVEFTTIVFWVFVLR